VGRARVAQFFVRLAESRTSSVRVRVIDLNAFPAALLEFEAPMGRRPPRLVLTVDVNTEGSISGLCVIANSRKLKAVP
jgi:hypothetical protein